MGSLNKNVMTKAVGFFLDENAKYFQDCNAKSSYFSFLLQHSKVKTLRALSLAFCKLFWNTKLTLGTVSSNNCKLQSI